MGCVSSTSASTDEKAIAESRAQPAKAAKEDPGFHNGSASLQPSPIHVGASPHSGSSSSSSSSSSKAVEQLQRMHTPTPSTSSGEGTPVGVQVSTSQPIQCKPGNCTGSKEPAAPPGLLVRHEITKYPTPQRPGLSPGVLELGWNSGHGSSPPASFSGLGTAPAEPVKPPSRQDALQISMSEDEEEDERDRASSSGERFDMQRWKRYYQWNHKKPDDLLAFFWKSFEPESWSLYCMSYRNQDSLFAPFQGENVVHGVYCRLEAAMQADSQGPTSNTFGLLHALADFHGAKQKVLGILIVRGQSPPAQLLHVLDEEEWALTKAETQDPMVKDFVSGLLAPRSNKATLEDYIITCSRVIPTLGRS